MPIYNKSQEELLLASYNAANVGAVKPLTLDNAKFGKPKPLAQKEPTDPNTAVVVRARQRRGYAGKQTIPYSRLDLGLLFKNAKPQMTLPSCPSVAKAVNNINGRFGLNLREEDVVDYAITPNAAFTLQVKPTCLQYVGSATFYFVPGKLVLQDLVVTTALDAQKHPVALDGRKCAKMLTYGLDFTEHRALIQAFTEGSMSTGDNLTLGRSDELVKLLASKGIPKWDYRGAKVRFANTADVPDANTVYDRCMIISNIDDKAISGDMYLHFVS